MFAAVSALTIIWLGCGTGMGFVRPRIGQAAEGVADTQNRRLILSRGHPLHEPFRDVGLHVDFLRTVESASLLSVLSQFRSALRHILRNLAT